MRWREFIPLIGGTAAWPFAMRARDVKKIPRIGFLGVSGLSKFGGWSSKGLTPPGEATLPTGGCDSRLDRQWQRGVGSAGPSRLFGEMAGRERAHCRDRTAEALRSGAIEIEADLER